ncbi:hypothetical protein D3C84_643000 [compost metagenome]
MSAICLEQAAVVRQSIHRAAVHLKVEQTIAVEVDGEVLTRTHGHAAHLRLDHAGVAHLGAEQGDAAAIARGQVAGVADGGVGTAAEAVITYEEVLVGDVFRRGHQTADVDLGGLAEDHAIGVDQEDLAVGIDTALDITAFGTDDAVQGNRLTTGLLEIDMLVTCDAEVVPVGDQLVGVLLDDHLLAIARHLDVALTGDLRWTGRQCERRHLAEQAEQAEQGGARRGSDLAAAGLAPPSAQLAGDIPASLCLVPDQCITLVH